MRGTTPLVPLVPLVPVTAPLPCSTPLPSMCRGASLLSTATPLSSVRRSARISSRRDKSKNCSSSCGSPCCSIDVDATPGRRISKPKFSQLSQKLRESDKQLLKKNIGTNKIKLDPIKPPIKRKSKSENDKNDKKQNNVSNNNESINLRSGTKLNSDSEQKSLNKSKETGHCNDRKKSSKLDENLKTDNKITPKENLDKRKSKKIAKNKSNEIDDVPAHNRSTRSNSSKLRNIQNESISTADEGIPIKDDERLPNKANEEESRPIGENGENRIENNKLDDITAKGLPTFDITAKGLPTFDQNSKALLFRRKLYSQNLDIQDHANLESSFLESVNVKNIYEPKKRVSKNRQSSNQTNLLSSESNKYSLRRNDTANDVKNEGKPKLTKLLSGILNDINIKIKGTSTGKNLDGDLENNKNKKTNDNEKLDDSDLSIFNVKSPLTEETAKRSPRLQNMKKPSSSSTKMSTAKKRNNVKNAKKETPEIKKEIKAPKKVIQKPKKEIEIPEKKTNKTKKVHNDEIVDIVEMENIKKPKPTSKKGYEIKQKEVISERRNRYDSSMRFGNSKQNDSDDEPEFFGYKHGKLVTSGKFSDNTFKKPLVIEKKSSKMLVVTRNDTVISKTPQISNLNSFRDEYTKSSFSCYGQDKSSLKQAEQTRQLVHPYNIVKTSPETFSWKKVMGAPNNRKRKLETHFNYNSNEMSSVFDSRNGSIHNFTSSVNKSFFPSEKSMSLIPMMQNQSSFRHGNSSRALIPANTSYRPETSYYKKCLNAIDDIINGDDDELVKNDGFKVPNNFPKRRKIVARDETIMFKGSYNNVHPRTERTMFESSANYSRFQGIQGSHNIRPRIENTMSESSANFSRFHGSYNQDSNFEYRSLYDRQPNRFMNVNSTTYSEFGNNTFKQPSNVPFIFKGNVKHIEKTTEKELIVNHHNSRENNITVNYPKQISQICHERSTIVQNHKQISQTCRENSTAIEYPKQVSQLCNENNTIVKNPLSQIKEKSSNVVNKLFAKYNIKPPETSSIKENKLPVTNRDTNKFNEKSYSVKLFNSVLPPPPIHKSVETFNTPENTSDVSDDDNSDFDVTISKCNKTVIANKQAVPPMCSPWRFRK